MSILIVADLLVILVVVQLLVKMFSGLVELVLDG